MWVKGGGIKNGCVNLNYDLVLNFRSRFSYRMFIIYIIFKLTFSFCIIFTFTGHIQSKISRPSDAFSENNASALIVFVRILSFLTLKERMFCLLSFVIRVTAVSGQTMSSAVKMKDPRRIFHIAAKYQPLLQSGSFRQIKKKKKLKTCVSKVYQTSNTSQTYQSQGGKHKRAGKQS